MAADRQAEIRRHRQNAVRDKALGQTWHRHLFFLSHTFKNFPNVTLRGATVRLKIYRTELSFSRNLQAGRSGEAIVGPLHVHACLEEKYK